MKTRQLSQLFFILLLSYYSTVLNAQVTIGIGQEPMKGALLDLKNNTDGSSSKGLLMPRVALTNLSDIRVDISGVLIGGETDHIGLVVYNVNEDFCSTIPIHKGIYVWYGDAWQYIGKEDTTPYEVSVYKDQDGNEFKARRFGKAGLWMIENLSAKNFASNLGGGSISPHAGGTTATAVAYTYPNAKASAWNTPPETWDISQGLLYTFAAAASGNTSTSNQGQTTEGNIPGVNEVENTGPLGTAPNKYVQGICPNGWHLPTDREWNQLEEEIYTNACAYSSSSTSTFAPTSWSSIWSTNFGPRGSSTTAGHGSAMKSQFAPKNSAYANTNGTSGTSTSMAQSGFQGILTGYVYGTAISYYGANGYFWSSSSNAAANSWHRRLVYDNVKVSRYSLERGSLCSVRCKQN
ncbi:FISUMP domain-containing protein [Dysgonomonas sp. ZJ709]|uniref:FISUMP domain-containing protein n=1 Tax=Dysgonomonas sp. ZJ709 TaxID=2709797 RepID=UPI0013EC2E95|nr:FISUMP domain-containing protein [Dysgonomonas sp. ZJ709]